MDSRRGLELWGPAGRWVFLNWPRGSWQYDLICGAIIVGLFVLPNPQPQAPLDLDGVLAAIETADADVTSFTADVVWTERIALFDAEETETGTMSFLKPAYYRREITSPNDRTELFANEEFSVYIPRVNQVTIVSLEGALDDGQDLAVPGMSSSAELKAAYEVSLEEVTTDPADGSRVYVIGLVPNPGTTPAKHWGKITIHVAENEWHPARRIVTENHVGDTDTIVLTNVDRSAGLSPGDFELDLPGGVEIVRQGADNP